MEEQLSEQDYFKKSKWILENLCSQYKIGFESLKEMMVVLRNKKLLSPNELNQFDQEISTIDYNLDQLIIHNENYFSTFDSIVDQEYLFDSPNLSYSFNQDDQHNKSINICDSENKSLSSLENSNYTNNCIQLWAANLTNCLQIENDKSYDLLLGDSFNQSLVTINQFEDEVSIKNLHQNKSESGEKKKSTKLSSNQNNRKMKTNETRIWYKCGWEGCSFGSFYKGVVKRHSYKRHSGKIKIDKSSNSTMHRFKCDWPGCDVSLVAYHKLVEHKRKHTGEKPFRCKWKSCNYATARLYSMIIHERTHKLDAFF